MTTPLPIAAPLDDPLYYLANFRSVLAWILSHHRDLLSRSETDRLQQFDSLPRAAQALLVRLVMRKGTLFRLDKLNYPELGVPLDQALEPLFKAAWLDPQPVLALEDLFRLLTRRELVVVFARRLEQSGLPSSVSKGAMRDALTTQTLPPAPLHSWWPDTSTQLVEVTDTPLFERVRLLFFGNLRQSWSEFVLTELGHQRYEKVEFKRTSRAFQSRAEVDAYLHLQRCREALEQEVSLAEVLAAIPSETAVNPWLESRRGRLLYALGHKAERGGQLDLAIQAYIQSSHSEARVRWLRVLERQGQLTEAVELAERSLASPVPAAQREAIERLLRRVARKLGRSAPVADPRPVIPVMDLGLPPLKDVSVEQAVARYLTEPDTVLFYVENTLINGLFGLLCWSAIYAPLPGAFFHPFHAGPADLYRDDFVTRRQALFDACLAALDRGDYREYIVQTYEQKQGIASPFVHWPSLDRTLLELALQCIPADHLKRMFRRLLEDPGQHRSGLPDLVQFWPEEGRYRLIEVKGPGDRLQDNQRRWFDYCLAQDIPVLLCQVQWMEPE
ncbi:VRR-NUC domain-containing protein [Sedimenticola thiotaurini]|uniref:phosphodiesterase I n=1 Tax=Sedimenticola thiotaurini TaxID=1543721 RepID=A0A0F7JWP2_9GAMM|nr:VRR-NUC domain-containing protein [Sedimenticola thiotaurini]AKH19789.1 nuclease [Sedimenticola thiotaurini]